jgi:hypothetical protein
MSCRFFIRGEPPNKTAAVLSRIIREGTSRLRAAVLSHIIREGTSRLRAAVLSVFLFGGSLRIKPPLHELPLP